MKELWLATEHDREEQCERRPSEIWLVDLITSSSMR
jgi:hypothetical protein